ncbi:hypothetical protein EYF80_038978 [Liparis tanakae]|uniref:Secreted protein n=1 Tax=Liparis tanakae TaxID=230148 RepID=A0A4Z2GC62_9TELE|nr:hypothetical protein EYF80_038978 [Liparis tanakae]
MGRFSVYIHSSVALPLLLGLKLGGLREGDGIRLVHGETSVDVGLLLALFVVQSGLQSEGVGHVGVGRQVHPLQFPLGQLLDDAGSVSVAQDVDHGPEPSTDGIAGT